ncbi:cytidylate kinase family protein [Candidatus Bathyarchaeota archaeon]|nr:cytidylate kinase family protein [Candidatus Bathyarchaeota archaeon]
MARSEKARKKPKKSIIVCVCGLAGSGKSTLAKKLAEKYKLKYCSGGNALKDLAMQEGYESLNRGWWERKEGMRFLEERSEDSKFDKAVDKKLLELARKGDVVLDSWTMPWLLKKGFKIWLEGSPKKRAERIAKRDGISVKEALKALRIKEKQTKAIYEKLYGFSLGEDFAPFHLILDTENLAAEEVFQVLCAVIDNMLIASSAQKSEVIFGAL